MPLATLSLLPSFVGFLGSVAARLVAWHRVPRSRLALVALAFGSFALFLSLAYGALFWSEWGRARIRDRINRAVSAKMQGQLQIERIEQIDLPRVDARGVRIVAPDGVAAIDVGRAEIEFDLAAFLTGDFAWRRADIRDGIVRVSEDARGRVNMEETFKSRAPSSPEAEETEEGGEMNMRTMVTSNMRLMIGGGSLPTLRLVDIHGIMRIQVAPDGTTQIRFDEYRGHFVQGLPNGKLAFRDVKGHVQTGHKRLLRFEGKGRFEGERVAFALDIFTEPKNRVLIDAYFPELSKDALSTLGVAAWSQVSAGALDMRVRHGK
jgi:hypothetical protein